MSVEGAKEFILRWQSDSQLQKELADVKTATHVTS